MNIVDYITGSAQAAHRQCAEASVPTLREGHSRTQELVDHIADNGPISTADLFHNVASLVKSGLGVVLPNIRKQAA